MWIRFFILIFSIAISFPSISKPMNPFLGALTPERAKGRVGNLLSFVLTIETGTPFDGVQVAAILSDGIELVKGDSPIEISNFKPKDKRKFIYTVRLKGNDEESITIVVKVTKGLSPHEAYSRVFKSTINPKKTKDRFETTTDSDGTKIIVNKR